MAGAEERAPAELGVGGRWWLEAQPLTPVSFDLSTGTKEPPLHPKQAALRMQEDG